MAAESRFDQSRSGRDMFTCKFARDRYEQLLSLTVRQSIKLKLVRVGKTSAARQNHNKISRISLRPEKDLQLHEKFSQVMARSGP